MLTSSRGRLGVFVATLALLGGCSSDGGGGDSPEPDGPLVGVVDHVLSTGQSNSIGFAAKPPLTTGAAARTLMFDTGVIPATDCDDDGCRRYDAPTALVPLVEGDHYFAAAVETMSAGLAGAASAASAADHDVLVTVHGRSGNIYECLRKGGCSFQDGKGYVRAFEEAMMEVADAKRLAKDARKRHVVRAVTVIHGESDHYGKTFPLDGTDGTPGAIQTYADALVEWQRDYEAGVKEITAQAEPVPMFVSQMSNWNDTVTSEIPLRQLEAHDRAAGKVVLVGATYMLPFAADCIHYTNHGERRLGEYFAKAYARVVIDGGAWEPLRPTGASVTDQTITVKYAVPSPPLVFDTDHVTDPGAYGFEYLDDSADPPFIQSVDLAGDDTVKITLSAAPTGNDRRLRYALNATPGTCPGPKTGPRGNLRDSDGAKSSYGYDLWNWSVSFEIPVE